MTIAYASEGSYRLSNGTSLPVPTPGGTVNGDLLFLMASVINSTVNITVPAGYTMIQSITTGNTTADGKRAFYWKVANNEGSTQTVTYDGTGSVIEAVCWRITGADTSSPVDTYAYTTGTGTTVTCPTVTTSYANDLVCYLGWSSSTTATTWSTPTGFTMQDTPTSSAASWGDAWKVQAAAGASGTASGTSNGSSTDRTIAMMMAFKPAPVGNPPLIGHQSYDIPVPRGIHPKRQDYKGFVAGPLSDMAPGPAPVCNYIDIPTIDRRQSQIVFEGIWRGPVRDDNAPDFRMPPPWTEVPCVKLRRGHSFSGYTVAPLSDGWPMAGFFSDLPPLVLTYRQRRDFTGWQQAPQSLDAPPFLQGAYIYALPVTRRMSWNQHQAVFGGFQSVPPGGTPVTYYATQTIPLTGVGNEGSTTQAPYTPGGGGAGPLGGSMMMDMPISRRGQKQWRR